MAKGSSDRPRVVLLVLMAVALTLLTAQFRNFLPVDDFQQGFRDVISPFRRVVDRATDPFQTVWNGIFNYEKVNDENERLQMEIARMRGEELSDKLEIACIDNQSIKILEIQRQGKKPQKIGEFMLGSLIKKGLVINNV